jgi:hypothetical protein
MAEGDIHGYRMVERPVYVSKSGNVLPPPKTGLPLSMMRVMCESVAIDYDDGRGLPEPREIEPERFTLCYVKFPVSIQVPDSEIPADYALHVACRLVDEGQLPNA